MRQRFHLLGEPAAGTAIKAVEETLVQEESQHLSSQPIGGTVLRRGHAIKLRGPAIHEARSAVSTFFGEIGQSGTGQSLSRHLGYAEIESEIRGLRENPE